MSNLRTDAPASERSDWADGMRRGLLIGAAVLAVVLPPAAPDGAQAIPAPASAVVAAVRVADFGAHAPSPDARHVADWVADSGDNAGHGFVIVDKKDAALLVFDAQARLQAASPILLGAARGDDSVPGIGSRPIADVRPEERTTPAGRFVAQRGLNIHGEDVVWVVYDDAVSMHRVRAHNPEERRLERLATPTIDDNRISYGCINVPAAFYDSHIAPLFATRRAVVYVLPDVKPVQQVFGSYHVAGLQAR